MASMLIEDAKKRAILVVDDEPDMTALLKTLLTNRGQEKIYTATAGAEAVSILSAQGEEIYVVLLDWRMSHMDGLDVMRHLANVHRYPVGIIVLTGYSSVESAVDFYNAGTDTVIPANYISKPFRPQDLLPEVERTVDRVHAKRREQMNISTKGIFQCVDRLGERMGTLETQLATLVSIAPGIQKELGELSRKQRGILAELGMELLKALVIALAILGIIYFGVDDLIRNIIQLAK
jgi:CheY-like chemotaxis protein